MIICVSILKCKYTFQYMYMIRSRLKNIMRIKLKILKILYSLETRLIGFNGLKGQGVGIKGFEMKRQGEKIQKIKKYFSSPCSWSCKTVTCLRNSDLKTQRETIRGYIYSYCCAIAGGRPGAMHAQNQTIWFGQTLFPGGTWGPQTRGPPPGGPRSCTG